MHRRTFIKPIVRTSLVLTLLLVVLTGVTFAALQKQTKLTGSTISTASADMLISQDSINYSYIQTGFNFGNIVPGGAFMPASGYPIYLKNAGGTPLAPKLAVSSIPTNPDAVDLTKVNIILTSPASGQAQTFSLQALIDSNATGGLALSSLPVLFPDQVFPYKFQASMTTDAFAGSSAAIGAIDFTITGTAVN